MNVEPFDQEQERRVGVKSCASSVDAASPPQKRRLTAPELSPPTEKQTITYGSATPLFKPQIETHSTETKTVGSVTIEQLSAALAEVILLMLEEKDCETVDQVSNARYLSRIWQKVVKIVDDNGDIVSIPYALALFRRLRFDPTLALRRIDLKTTIAVASYLAAKHTTDIGIHSELFAQAMRLSRKTISEGERLLLQALDYQTHVGTEELQDVFAVLLEHLPGDTE